MHFFFRDRTARRGGESGRSQGCLQEVSPSQSRWCGHARTQAVRHGSANMDVLVALGTNAAYLYSIISMFTAAVTDGEAKDFFETAAMLITLILLGKYLEASAKTRTSDAITKLMNLAPMQAVLLRKEDKVGGTGLKRAASLRRSRLFLRGGRRAIASKLPNHRLVELVSFLRLRPPRRSCPRAYTF